MLEVTLILFLIVTVFSVQNFEEACQDMVRIWVKQLNHTTKPKITVDKREIKFYLYTNKNKQSRIHLTERNIGKINNHLETKILIHDWFENSKEKWIFSMKNAYLINCCYNIIVMDWSEYSERYYSVSVALIKNLGNVLGDFIKKCSNKASINLSHTHLIGFGLGAHIAGAAGKRMKKILPNRNLYRITGLDPNNDLVKATNPRLHKMDAKFVDVVHTNTEWLGIDKPLGQVDFIINPGGKNQPFCPQFDKIWRIKLKDDCSKVYKELKCSHDRSHIYWTESINRNKFTINGIFMGEHGSLNAKGTYMIRTRASSPYGRG